MLRIISGKYRHLKIEAPNTDKTRPTTDRVREALMSALGNKLEEACVLDLFAGSGALGLESLSRGAKNAYFVDKSKEAIKTIKINLNNLKENNACVLMLSYDKALNYFKEKCIKFDIVFIDPPYKMKDVYKEVRNKLIEYSLLKDGAIIVEESNEKFLGEYGISKDYKYGIVHIRITKELIYENSNLSR